MNALYGITKNKSKAVQLRKFVFCFPISQPTRSLTVGCICHHKKEKNAVETLSILMTAWLLIPVPYIKAKVFIFITLFYHFNLTILVDSFSMMRGFITWIIFIMDKITWKEGHFSYPTCHHSLLVKEGNFWQIDKDRFFQEVFWKGSMGG